MARNTNTIDYNEDYYRGFAKIYFERVLEIIIKFGNLRNEAGLILDYGCGVGHLKRKLADRNIVGYDIISKLSDVEDWHSLVPDKIVLSAVLEHLYTQEIKTLIDEFKKISPHADLIVSLPTENWISKIAMRLAGQKNAHDDHVTRYKEINSIIEKQYRPVQRRYVFLRMTQVTRYVHFKNGK